MRENLKYILFVIFLSGGISLAFGQIVPMEEREYYNKEDNAKCFRCHASQYFEEYSEELEETRTRKMFKGLIIDSTAYYQSNHWSFSCTDCHSYDYYEYPHADELHFEVLPGCEDCHGGDPAMEKYSFDAIVEEYNKSYHTQIPDHPYSCWSCHDPHTFRLELRTGDPITTIVSNDNGMCLHCHSQVTSADVMLGISIDPLMETHSWLPGTENHLKNVRCLECHAEIRDDVMVAHNILPKEQAVNTCDECHSSESRLYYTLYKYKIEQGEIERGFFGAMGTGENFIIGASRHSRLNWISLIIFGGLLFVVFVHVFFRIIKK